MPKIDKAQILAGRKAVDTYRREHAKLYSKPWHRGIPEEHTPLLNIMVKALKGLGFNTIQEFFGVNTQLNEQEFMSCYKVIGECDGCVGRKRWCLIECVATNQSHYDERLGTVVIDLQKLRMGNVLDWINSFGEYRQGDEIPKIVYDKKGHSCACRWVKVKEPDIDWRWQ